MACAGAQRRGLPARHGARGAPPRQLRAVAGAHRAGVEGVSDTGMRAGLSRDARPSLPRLPIPRTALFAQRSARVIFVLTTNPTWLDMVQYGRGQIPVCA